MITIINGEEYVGCKIVMSLLGWEHLHKNNFRHPSLRNKIKNVRMVRRSDRDWFNKADVIKLRVERDKNKRAMVNAQRFVMLIQDETMTSSDDLCLELGFKNKVLLNRFLLRREESEDSQAVLDKAKIVYPLIYDEYMREYFI